MEQKTICSNKANMEMSLQEVQHEALELLCEFSRFCEDRGLRWSLAYGTLLGAVRHGGFIPWDDDVDLFMPREDYDRFLADPLVSEFAFTIVPGTGEPWLFAKVCSRRTRWDETFVRHSDKPGVFIDVFPWDYVPERAKAEKSYRRIRFLHKVYHWGYSFERSCEQRWDIKANIKGALGFFSRLKSAERHRRSIDRAIAKARGEEAYVNFLSPYPFAREYVSRDECSNTTQVEFEGHSFPCIGNPEQHLCRVYGDNWATPVKQDERMHGKAYWRDV